MQYENISLKIEFKNSGEKKLIPLSSIVNKTIDFLENYGEASIVGKKFHKIIGSGDGETKFKNLLKESGYKTDIKNFFCDLIQILEKTNDREILELKVGKIVLPYRLVLAILEVIIPGDKIVSIKSVKQLIKLTNTRIPDTEKEDLQKVINLYPVRLSSHIIRQMRLSKAIGYQYMPFQDELNDEGHVHTWVGQFHRGIIEQMYANRIIFILQMSCPVYCRFCFRKHKECRNQKIPTQEHVKNAVSYVKNSPDIKEIVLTGGDPFMNRATLTMAVDLLKDIPHVQSLRIATRSISYYPYLFFNNNNFWINYLKRKQLELEQKNKRIEVATHFIHPDEISIESLDIVSELTASGIVVYVQTPFLKNCNNNGELVELYRKLRSVGAEMHYLYIPCSPIKGNRTYITEIASGINAGSFMRANLSDRAIPKICTATKIGKIDWHTNGWAVERDKKDPKYIWIRTPYTEDYFRTFSPILQLSEFARVNVEGTLDVKYLVDIGDEELYLGSREPYSSNAVFPPELEIANTSDTVKESLAQIKEQALKDQRFQQSIIPMISSALFRTHKTRVEFDIDGEEQEMKQNITYIKKDENITDIVFSSKNDIINSLFRLAKILKILEDVHHVTIYRLRSLNINYKPGLYTRSKINQLGTLNNLNTVNPKRIEIETQFLHSAEINSEHRTITTLLRHKGITVYNNTPLLPYINDSQEEIRNLTFKCREYGIEFHHLYIAGLPIQKEREEEYPVDINNVIDIATFVRRYGSGREIPRFIIKTFLGEVEFGLSSKIVGTDEEGRVFMAIKPYDIKYFRDMYADYTWPDSITFDENNYPVVLVPGLKKVSEFLID